MLDAPKSGLPASQQLPRHLRRRAVSHNPKRLPRRLRAAHLSQRTKSGTEPGAAPGLRRPSRRWRRRPGNLLAEYNRRQRGPGAAAWLETHIWHAKRFHMTRAWGHALPRTPTDKCWRQTYRGLVRGCVAWDCSYLQVVAARKVVVRIIKKRGRRKGRRLGALKKRGLRAR